MGPLVFQLSFLDNWANLTLLIRVKSEISSQSKSHLQNGIFICPWSFGWKVHHLSALCNQEREYRNGMRGYICSFGFWNIVKFSFTQWPKPNWTIHLLNTEKLKCWKKCVSFANAFLSMMQEIGRNHDLDKDKRVTLIGRAFLKALFSQPNYCL